MSGIYRIGYDPRFRTMRQSLMRLSLRKLNEDCQQQNIILPTTEPKEGYKEWMVNALIKNLSSNAVIDPNTLTQILSFPKVKQDWKN